MRKTTRIPARLLLVLLAALLVEAAPVDGAAAERYPRRDRYERVWEQKVREQGVDPATVVNPLSTTEEMRQIVNQVVGAGEARQQLVQLQQYLFDEDRFPFNYDARGTFSASEAFERREGNCVSFTSLFISLGRALGIPLVPALIQRGDTEREGNLVVINTHMVALYYHSDGVTMYDFAQSRDQPVEGMSILDDVWLSAIFLNNRGVEALRSGNYDTAVAQLETALKLTPDFLGAYGNLGVAYRMMGDTETALETYRRALEIERRDPTILNNLASLYQSLGMTEEAQGALRAASLANATPYLLIARGDLELSQGDVKKAHSLYRRARRTDPDIPEPYLAIARLEIQRQRHHAALRALEKALALDPENPTALQLRRTVQDHHASGGR